ncbi:MAG: shikimate kinase, partial [Candidatus Hydrogenedentes bacterium]|nr:shikimate kinase [Candidatus Hydrogenedentota bacterium]
MLIGYRGAGKSAVARALGARLGWPAVHMDAEIERRLGTSIADYVSKQGWDAFRDVESQVAVELSRRDGIIIDTGGGIVTRPENMCALKEHGLVVWLRVSV